MKAPLKIILMIQLIFISLSGYAQESSDGEYTLFRSKTFVKNPLDLRDPFKRKFNKKRNAKIKDQNNGIYTNFNQSLEGKSLESIQVVGIIIGPERRAMVKAGGDTNKDGTAAIYYVKEGMKLGANGAEVRAILPGGIVLVEKIKNVYDQDEYLETVIPVSE